jgi:hypothetical protein
MLEVNHNYPLPLIFVSVHSARVRGANSASAHSERVIS